MNNFCIFVISHGRADKIPTIKTLQKVGYTGKVFIVCDNEDSTVADYQLKHGFENVLIFDKKHYASLVDNADNFQNRRTTTHARNACFDFAKQMGFEYFLVLDDDYIAIRHLLTKQQTYKQHNVKNFDNVVKAFLQFLECDNRIASICFLQGGDLVGGEQSYEQHRRMFPFQKRKAMNSFFCKTERRFWFFSRLNEDVNTYLLLGSVGHIFLSVPELALWQAKTQSAAGGMSESYLSSGTYVKSFYTVMIRPSCAIVTVTAAMKRLHHKISWNNAVPKIICESHKKQ